MGPLQVSRISPRLPGGRRAQTPGPMTAAGGLGFAQSPVVAGPVIDQDVRKTATAQTPSSRDRVSPADRACAVVTSRWVTRRTVFGPTALTSTLSCRAAATSADASSHGTSTMLV